MASLLLGLAVNADSSPGVWRCVGFDRPPEGISKAARTQALPVAGPQWRRSVAID